MVRGERRAVQINPEVAKFSGALDVRVRINETRRHAAALQRNHASRRSNHALDFRVGPDRDDTIAANRDRLCNTIRRIERDDLSAPQHKVGRSV
jgi:hypothetical protein